MASREAANAARSRDRLRFYKALLGKCGVALPLRMSAVARTAAVSSVRGKSNSYTSPRAYRRACTYVVYYCADTFTYSQSDGKC